MTKQGEYQNGAFDPHDPREGRLGANVSSSSFGYSRAGDMAGEKKMNLLHAQGELQLGRRPEPVPETPWYKRKEFYIGLAAGAVVVIIVLAMMVVLGDSSSLA